MMTQSQDFVMRPPILQDLEAVTNLVNRCSLADIGIGNETVSQLRSFWIGQADKPEEVDLSAHYAVVVAPTGELIGYLDTDDDEPNELFFRIYVHPEFREQGIEEQLLEEAERRTIAFASQCEPDAEVRALIYVWDSEVGLRRTLEAYGYENIRYSRRMEIELNQKPPDPVFPDGISLRSFVLGQDERAMYDAWSNAMASDWNTSALTFEEFLYYKIEREKNFDPTLWFMAMDGEEIAGLAICRWERPGDPDAGHVRDLGVQAPWRRRGIGLALLHALANDFYRRGKARLSLGVDGLNETGANQVYEKAGMKQVLLGYTYEKSYFQTPHITKLGSCQEVR